MSACAIEDGCWPDQLEAFVEALQKLSWGIFLAVVGVPVALVFGPCLAIIAVQNRVHGDEGERGG
jgi:hypothetical protein